MSPPFGPIMTSRHHVAVTWEGSDSESFPLLEILESKGYAYTVQHNEKITHIEIQLQNDSIRQLRDDVDALLVHFSSLED